MDNSELRYMASACDAIFGQRPRQHSDSDLISLIDASKTYLEFEDGSVIRRDDKGWICCTRMRSRRYPTLRAALNVVANGSHYNTISEEVE